jgi:hypothetical protein
MSELSDGYNLIGLSQVIKILKNKLLSVSNFRIITFFFKLFFCPLRAYMENDPSFSIYLCLFQ